MEPLQGLFPAEVGRRAALSGNVAIADGSAGALGVEVDFPAAHRAGPVIINRERRLRLGSHVMNYDKRMGMDLKERPA